MYWFQMTFFFLFLCLYLLKNSNRKNAPPIFVVTHLFFFPVANCIWSVLRKRVIFGFSQIILFQDKRHKTGRNAIPSESIVIRYFFVSFEINAVVDTWNICRIRNFIWYCIRGRQISENFLSILDYIYRNYFWSQFVKSVNSRYAHRLSYTPKLI